jgi:hypothetical protein
MWTGRGREVRSDISKTPRAGITLTGNNARFVFQLSLTYCNLLLSLLIDLYYLFDFPHSHTGTLMASSYGTYWVLKDKDSQRIIIIVSVEWSFSLLLYRSIQSYLTTSYDINSDRDGSCNSVDGQDVEKLVRILLGEEELWVCCEWSEQLDSSCCMFAQYWMKCHPNHGLNSYWVEGHTVW